MKPDFSEFSYGYAVTEEFSNWQDLRLQTAPEFPSLLDEGKKGKGYDVALKPNGTGLPLFLQFKCAQYIKYTWTTQESKLGLFRKPFYRFDLRPTKYSSQHPSLMDLEAQGNEVYYVAPVFHKTPELDHAYSQRQVINQSIFFRPKDIGSLPDNKTHCISFDETRIAYRLSNPIKVASLEAEQVASRLRMQVRQRGDFALSEDSLSRLANSLIKITNGLRIDENEGESILIHQLPPLRQIAYLSRTFLDCAFFIVSEIGNGNS